MPADTWAHCGCWQGGSYASSTSRSALGPWWCTGRIPMAGTRGEPSLSVMATTWSSTKPLGGHKQLEVELGSPETQLIANPGCTWHPPANAIPISLGLQRPSLFPLPATGCPNPASVRPRTRELAQGCCRSACGGFCLLHRCTCGHNDTLLQVKRERLTAPARRHRSTGHRGVPAPCAPARQASDQIVPPRTAACDSVRRSTYGS